MATRLCRNCRQAMHGATKKNPCTVNPPDPYTESVCRLLWKAFVSDEKNLSEIEKENPGIHIRRSGLCMELSESMVKFSIQSAGDKTCRKANKGDLFSDVEGQQEVKSITAIDSPTSFGPNQHWNVIYFLDASEWKNNNFTIWRVPIPNTHEFWKTLPVSKKQTKGDFSEAGKRPRPIWSTAIKPLLDERFPDMMKEPFYKGDFEGIFTAKAPVAQPLA